MMNYDEMQEKTPISQNEGNVKLEVKKPGIYLHGKLQWCRHLPAHSQQ